MSTSNNIHSAQLFENDTPRELSSQANLSEGWCVVATEGREPTIVDEVDSLSNVKITTGNQDGTKIDEAGPYGDHWMEDGGRRLAQEDSPTHLALLRHIPEGQKTWRERHREALMQCFKIFEESLQELDDALQEEPADIVKCKSIRNRLGAYHSRALIDLWAFEEVEGEVLEQAVMQWDNHLFPARSVNEEYDPDLPRDTPPMIAQWLERTGDVSIAQERLVELEGQETSHSSNPSPEMTLPGDVSNQTFRGRRRQLRSEYKTAKREARALKEECLAQGLNPEAFRWRRRSSASTNPKLSERERASS